MESDSWRRDRKGARARPWKWNQHNHDWRKEQWHTDQEDNAQGAGTRILAFPEPSKTAPDLIERKLGRTSMGLGAAVSALAKQYGSCPAVNRATTMARDLHVAAALERHFTQLGTAKWLETLSKSLDAIGEAKCLTSDSSDSELGRL